jgi:alpha-L-fucosidase
MNKLIWLSAVFCLLMQNKVLSQPVSSASSLANRPISPAFTPAIEQWQKLNFGLFVHWGVYAIPAGVWQEKKIAKLAEQIQRHADISYDDYSQLAATFNPIHFDAEGIALLAKSAGMKYIIFTAKHHDGFAMFDSQFSDFNIVDHTPFKRDIVKELAVAAKKHGLKLGLYYSTPDWHFNGPTPERNPIDGKISVFSKVSKANEDFQVKQLTELMTNYGEIVEVFFDMGEPTPAQSKRFRDTVKSHQQNTIINGRIMNGYGDMLTFPDNHIPTATVTSVPWESPGTFYHSWGYKSWLKGAPVNEQISTQVKRLSAIIASGGNYLLNIGPNALGEVVVYEQQILKGIGAWLKDYQEAFFDVQASPIEKWPWGYITYNKKSLYLHIHQWPEHNLLPIDNIHNTLINIHSLENKSSDLAIKIVDKKAFIDLSNTHKNKYLTIIAAQYNGELKISPLAISANEQGTITLLASDSISHGTLGFKSYRSYLKNQEISWYVDIKQTGCYAVVLNFKLPFASKDFILSSQEQKLSFTLQGYQQKQAKKSALMDGNEQIHPQKPPENKAQKWQQQSLGTLSFNQLGIQQVRLKQGKAFSEQSSMQAFKAQDKKYRKLSLQIDSMTLTPASCNQY